MTSFTSSHMYFQHMDHKLLPFNVNSIEKPVNQHGHMARL